MAEATDPAAAPELIPVRPGEEVDTQALAEYLRGKLPGSDRPLALAQFAGGHANLTYRLCFGAGADAAEYVLRRPPLGPVAPSSHDMGREYRALSLLYRAFPLAPRAYLYCDDPAVIGAPFFVMERRRGVVVRGVVPERFGGGRDPEANRKLSEVVIDTLVDFHDVDPKSIGLDQLGKPLGFLQRQVRGWARRFERARTHEIPVADEVVRWLEDNLPESPPPTLVHNDWRLDNMAVAEDEPGRCVAVYDWDMCTVGDPLADLGTLLCQWENAGEPGGGFSAMPCTVPGFLTREAAARRYGKRSTRSLGTLPYYLVFGTFKMAVVLQQIYVRFHRGQTRDARFEGMAKAAEQLFQLAASRRT